MLSITEVKNKISEAKARQDKLLELRLSDEITKEMFQEKSNAIDEEIFALDDEFTRLRKIADSNYDCIEAKLENLREALEQDFEFTKGDVPETVIDTFVDEIRVTEDAFEWKLNIANQSIDYTVKKKRNNEQFNIRMDNVPMFVDGTAGCNRQQIGIN